MVMYSPLNLFYVTCVGTMLAMKFDEKSAGSYSYLDPLFLTALMLFCYAGFLMSEIEKRMKK